MEVKFTVFAVYDARIVPYRVVKGVALGALKTALHSVIPIADSAQTRSVFLGYLAEAVGSDVEQIASAHRHNAVDRGNEVTV